MEVQNIVIAAIIRDQKMLTDFLQESKTQDERCSQ
jgi:hypothetical protein